MKTKEQALADLGRVIADEMAIVATLTPRQAAERAWHPGGPSVDDLEALIAAGRRGDD